MTKTGKLSRREMETLNRAYEIISSWSEKAEDNGSVDKYLYEAAMNAVCGLCEFISNYEEA